MSPERIERFFARSASGDRPVGPGMEIANDDPSTIVVYRGKRNPVELAAAKFESYLREEGLESVIAERRRLGESSMPGREVFSRCAKALIGGEDQVIGLRLELVRSGKGVLLLYEGRPLRDALVIATRRGSDRPFLARTGADGHAAIPFAAGVWLVTSVHMIRLENEPIEADWESLWASETFEVR